MTKQRITKYRASHILGVLILITVATPIFAEQICQFETLADSAQHLKQEGWEEHFDESDITVYNRTAPESEIREVLATTVFSSPANNIFNILLDYPKYVEFMPYVEKSSVIKQHESGTILFQLLNFPWPISDRYFVIKLSSITDNKGGYKISWTLADDTNNIQSEKGIALKTDDGYWKLCPIQSNNSTYIEYFIHTDPGGSIPIWIVNQANNQAVPNVLRALNERANEAIGTQTTNTSNE